MLNFCNLFEKLYSQPSLTPEQLSKLVINKDEPRRITLENNIDQEISFTELKTAIKLLKGGKAVSEDLISNEFLKVSGYSMRISICHLFNECLLLESRCLSLEPRLTFNHGLRNIAQFAVYREISRNLRLPRNIAKIAVYHENVASPRQIAIFT